MNMKVGLLPCTPRANTSSWKRYLKQDAITPYPAKISALEGSVARSTLDLKKDLQPPHEQKEHTTLFTQLISLLVTRLMCSFHRDLLLVMLCLEQSPNYHNSYSEGFDSSWHQTWWTPCPRTLAAVFAVTCPSGLGSCQGLCKEYVVKSVLGLRRQKIVLVLYQQRERQGSLECFLNMPWPFLQLTLLTLMDHMFLKSTHWFSQITKLIFWRH